MARCRASANLLITPRGLARRYVGRCSDRAHVRRGGERRARRTGAPGFTRASHATISETGASALALIGALPFAEKAWLDRATYPVLTAPGIAGTKES